MAPDVPLELYDMESDPGETKNLYEERPEIAKRLMQTYENWFTDVSSTRPDNSAPPRIVLGTEYETSTTLSTQDRRETKDGGEWLLRFEGKRHYDVEFLWKEPVSDLELELKVGDVLSTLKIESETDTARIHKLRIPSGEASLSTRIVKGNKKNDPYHIVLHRR
jgi:hypothetical protein